MRLAKKNPFTKLVFEELESRSLLSAATLGISGGGFPVATVPLAESALFALATPGLTGAINPGVVGPIAAFGGLPPGVGIAPGTTNPVVNPNSLLGFDATSGNGQITLTTGAEYARY